MRSLVIHAPRDLRIEDTMVEGPGPGEVAVRVATGGICGSKAMKVQLSFAD
jgi:L-idonate 5-dehydrogenase